MKEIELKKKMKNGRKIRTIMNEILRENDRN
jgi:hypothetical protein